MVTFAFIFNSLLEIIMCKISLGIYLCEAQCDSSIFKQAPLDAVHGDTLLTELCPSYLHSSVSCATSVVHIWTHLIPFLSTCCKAVACILFSQSVSLSRVTKRSAKYYWLWLVQWDYACNIYCIAQSLSWCSSSFLHAWYFNLGFWEINFLNSQSCLLTENPTCNL